MICKSEIHHSIVSLAFALEEAILCGWRLDKDKPPSFVGFHYEISLCRDEEAPVKMTTQERLAKAREAKAAKRQQTEGESK